MRLLFSIVFCMFFTTILVNAQSLTVTGDNSVLTSNPCLQTTAYLEVKNISNKEQEVLCEKRILSQPSGMENYFCWGGNCYGVGQFVSSSSLILQSGEGNSTSFGGYFDAYCATGSATVEYCFYSITDSSDRSCILITYHGPATDIAEEERFILNNFYPNPTNEEYIVINYEAKDNSHLEFIDILGNVVQKIKLDDFGSQKVYIGDLSKGIYFGNLVYNDKIVAIQKLVKN